MQQPPTLDWTQQAREPAPQVRAQQHQPVPAPQMDRYRFQWAATSTAPRPAQDSVALPQRPTFAFPAASSPPPQPSAPAAAAQPVAEPTPASPAPAGDAIGRVLSHPLAWTATKRAAVATFAAGIVTTALLPQAPGGLFAGLAIGGIGALGIAIVGDAQRYRD